MKANKQNCNINPSHTWAASSAMLPCVCAFGLIVAVFSILGPKAWAEAPDQTEPNSPSILDSTQATPDVNTPDANVPVANLPDANLPDANMPDANLPGEHAGSKTQQQPEQQSTKVTERPAPGAPSKNMQKLWHASIDVRFDPNDKSKAQLGELIAAINSVKFKQLETEFKTPQDDSSAAEKEPNRPSPEPTIQQQNTLKIERPSPPEISPDSLLTPETLRILSEYISKPQEVNEPFELAEILYRSGHLPEAAAVYQQALSRMDPEDSKTAKKRAWILSQIGNCLRQTNPQDAMQRYKQLINDYPDSIWIEFAAGMNEIVGWLDQEKPHDLIAEIRQIKMDLSN